jgi:flagellar biosynthesis/type III secretory pathway protein FliH
MAESFAPMARDVFREGFAPTCLIEALDAARREAAEAEREPPPPDPVAAVIAEARRAALEEGRARGLAEAAAAQPALAARSAALALEALRAGSTAAAAAAQEAAAEVARLALGMLDAALPGLAAQNGAALAAAFARRLAPMLQAAPEARLLVAPGLAEPTRALLAGAAIAIAEDETLPPGDARAEWRSGGAALDLAARRREIAGVLEAAGLGPRE